MCRAGVPKRGERGEGEREEEGGGRVRELHESHGVVWMKMEDMRIT